MYCTYQARKNSNSVNKSQEHVRERSLEKLGRLLRFAFHPHVLLSTENQCPYFSRYAPESLISNLKLIIPNGSSEDIETCMMMMRGRFLWFRSTPAFRFVTRITEPRDADAEQTRDLGGHTSSYSTFAKRKSFLSTLMRGSRIPFCD